MKRVFLSLTIVSLAVVLSYSPRSSAMNGGTLLTTHQERAGIFEIATYDGSTYVRRCTATVLYSSLATNRTWLVTAGHCFSYVTAPPLFTVVRHFSAPRAAVRYDLDADTSGTDERWTSASQSQVYVNPDWVPGLAPTTWWGAPGIAIIRVNAAIPIFAADGSRIAEFRRPIYTGPPQAVSAPYSFASMEIFSRNVFCGQGDENLRCDKLSNLWWSPNFRNKFFQMPKEAFDAGYFVAGWGDDGGPLLKYAPGLTRQWEGAAGVLDVAMYGAVLGVLQAPTVVCDYIQDSNCDPADGLASRFEDIEPWLNTINDAYQDIPRITNWTLTFPGLFTTGTGNLSNLTALARGQYTFPAYTGRMVGVSIDKSTDRVHTWYDNGLYTVGTGADLDAYSQASGPAPIPDVTPTRSFSGPSGRPHSQIVAMNIDPAGNTHTWYADGYHVTGSVSDLDAVQQPQPYRLPVGKTAGDIVAIATRPSGGLLAYYRDGTFSEGVFYDLGLFAQPRPFSTGNNRRAEEIAGIDTYRSGLTLTLFDHPRF